MEDKLGNIVNEGDILITESGYGHAEDNIPKYSLAIWEMPSGGFHNFNTGYQYTVEGVRHSVQSMYLQTSIKLNIDTIPISFINSFKHGMNRIETTLKEGTPLQRIKNSDWKLQRENINNSLERLCKTH